MVSKMEPKKNSNAYFLSICTERDKYKQQRDELYKSLIWSLEYIGDGQLPDDGTPEHECGYFIAPDEGACEFCDKYWIARALIAKIEGEK